MRQRLGLTAAEGIRQDRWVTAPTAIRRSLLVLAYLAFISLGLPDGLIGVGWPSIRADFGVSTASVGLLLFAGTAGYLTSSVAAGFTITRLGVGWLLAGSTALASFAMAGYALSPGLLVMVPCALLAGLGGGAIDSGLNVYAASAFGPKHMNWMHAFFGLGVAFGPLIMTSVVGGGLSWRWGYGVVALGQSGLALAFVLSARSWVAHRGPAQATPDGAQAAPHDASPQAGSHDAPSRDASHGALPQAGPRDAMASADIGAPSALAALAPIRSRETLRLPAVWLGVLAFATYVAIEVSAGLWAFLLLTTARGVGATVAGLCVSAYWASLFLGRVVQGVVAERIGTNRVLFVSLIGMAAGAALVAVPAPGWLAVIGLTMIGFSAAPVFPLLMLTTADRVGTAHADRAIGMQVGGAGLGGALIPAGIGVLLTRTDVEALGPALLVLSLALLALCAAANRGARNTAHNR
jgi:fucose permease